MDKNTPVCTGIFFHVSPTTLDSLKRVKEQGMIFVSLEIVDDLPILRFKLPKARLRDGFVK